MSYFAKPNFIIYDEWFDEDLRKKKLGTKKYISNIHEFFYKQSNLKVGASENNMKLEIKINKKQLITNNHFEKNNSVSNKKFGLFVKLSKNKIVLGNSKKLIFTLSIFSLIFIFGFLVFFNAQSNKYIPKNTNKLFNTEKGY